jgi:hypothetical protein
MFELESTRPKPNGSVGRGVFLGLVLHLFQILLVPAVAILFGLFYPHDQPGLAGLLFSFYAWSVTQFLYLGPATWLAFRKGDSETGKGILLVGAVGVLINGTCDALFFGATHR